MPLEWTLDEANARLAAEGYPPIQRLPADPAALSSWKRAVDARRELDSTGRVTDATLTAVASFCHCFKCPSAPRGELPVFCLGGASDYHVNPVNCYCPSCEVYQVAALHGTNYYCITGEPARKLVKAGGAAEAAKRFLDKEIGKGNPGKRLPERLMAPPHLAGLSQDEVEVPEKVPGS